MDQMQATREIRIRTTKAGTHAYTYYRFNNGCRSSFALVSARQDREESVVAMS